LILNSFVGWLISPKPRALKLGQKYFKKEITERLKMDEEYGKEYDGRPVRTASLYVSFY
jgi:hypothetical protein